MFFGWRVVGAAFLLAVWSSDFGLYSLSIYLVALQHDHGWSASAISFAITGYYLVGALLMSRLGEALRRLGTLHTSLTGIAAMAGGVFALACVSHLWQLYLAFAAMALGWATTSSAAITILLAPWFERRRGLALSLALLGAPAGGLIVAPALLTFVGMLGFRWGVAVALIGMLAALVPAVALTLRRTPADLGLSPDGAAVPDHADAGCAASSAPGVPPLNSQDRTEPLRTTRYWTISLAFAAAFTAQIGILTHLVAYLTSFRGAGGAALALSVTTASALLGRLALGLWVDRLPLRHVSCAVFLAQAVGVGFLTFANTGPALYAGCALFGVGVGNVVTLPGLLVQREFRPEYFARVVSWIAATNQVTFAFGPSILGVLRDLTGSYGAALGFAVALDVGAAALILMGSRAPSLAVRHVLADR